MKPQKPSSSPRRSTTQRPATVAKKRSVPSVQQAPAADKKQPPQATQKLNRAKPAKLSKPLVTSTNRWTALRVLKIATVLVALIGLSWVVIDLIERELQLTSEPPPTVSPTVQLGGPFTLIDQHGQLFSDAQLQGRYTLLYFGFTFCPDVCPTSLKLMTEAHSMLGQLQERVQMVFVSVDPGRDYPAAMAEYTELFSPKLIGLTGTRAQIEHMTKLYKVYAQKRTVEGMSGYVIDHSTFFYLLGPNGRVLTMIQHDVQPNELAAVVRQYVKQPTP